MPKFWCDSEVLHCRVCKSADFEIVGKARHGEWYNVKCSDGHLMTVRDDLLLYDGKKKRKLDDNEEDAVAIVEHILVRTYEKHIIVYLPEGEEPEDYLFEVEDRFDCTDCDTVMHETKNAKKVLPWKDVYGSKGRLDLNKFDIMTGKVKGVPKPRQAPSSKIALGNGQAALF